MLLKICEEWTIIYSFELYINSPPYCGFTLKINPAPTGTLIFAFATNPSAGKHPNTNSAPIEPNSPVSLPSISYPNNLTY